MGIKRGEIYYFDLGINKGSEQNGMRPCVVLQNNLGNKYSSTVIVGAITSKIDKTVLPTHVLIKRDLISNVILLEQIRTVDKSRIRECLGSLTKEEMDEVDAKLCVAIGINPFTISSLWHNFIKIFFRGEK